ncbi:MAG TPA: glycosyltransferase family A protein [Puia sp.]|nr:glycosyltransferase family A protein [Puia sp.]
MNPISVRPGLVSVLIPCYNHGKYIDDAVESVLQQTYKNVEIIVVDAGSDDPLTRHKLAAYEKPATRVLTSPRQIFPSEARNLAFSVAAGEYLLTLDADDLVEKTFIEKTMKRLSEDAGSGAASGKVMYFGYEEGFLDYRGGMLEDILRQMGSHLCALIRRSAWMEIGGFDESVNDGYEDWEFWIRLTKAGWAISIVPEILVYYRQKESSRVTEVFIHQTDLIKQLQDKHKDVYSNPFLYLKKMLDGNTGNTVTQ